MAKKIVFVFLFLHTSGNKHDTSLGQHLGTKSCVRKESFLLNDLVSVLGHSYSEIRMGLILRRCILQSVFLSVKYINFKGIQNYPDKSCGQIIIKVTQHAA